MSHILPSNLKTFQAPFTRLLKFILRNLMKNYVSLLKKHKNNMTINIYS